MFMKLYKVNIPRQAAHKAQHSGHTHLDRLSQQRAHPLHTPSLQVITDIIVTRVSDMMGGVVNMTEYHFHPSLYLQQPEFLQPVRQLDVLDFSCVQVL